MGIDAWEVIDAAKTKPFGFMAFYPGPGVGGHCIPIDPFYLTWKAREYGLSTRMIDLAGDIINALPRAVVEKTAEALDDRLAKPLGRSRILIVGLAYKKNVDDMRESPALPIIELLLRRGALVEYYDPHIPEPSAVAHEHPNIAAMRCVEWNTQTFKRFDCAIVLTEHSNIDYEPLLQSAPFVVDTRNALSHLADRYGFKIVKA
jgi:UDP-N-acetyl-D-glucosamine dehydrogenase